MTAMAIRMPIKVIATSTSISVKPLSLAGSDTGGPPSRGTTDAQGKASLAHH